MDSMQMVSILLTGEQRRSLRHAVVQNTLQREPEGLAILRAIQVGEADTVLPVILDSEEREAVEAIVRSRSGGFLYRDFEALVDVCENVAMAYVNLARAQYMWLEHIGFDNIHSRYLVRSLQRAGLRHIAIKCRFAQAELNSVAERLPSAARLAWDNILEAAEWAG